jgi:hypothetical protein
MNLQILKKANFPKSYSTQDEAFDNGTGDYFFILPNKQLICISENDDLFIELLDNGFELLTSLEQLN